MTISAPTRGVSTVVLSAASPLLPGLQALSVVLEAELRHAGQTDVRTFDLATMRLAYCQGEFDCWIKTPGLCRAHDAESDIVQAIHDASQVVLLDAVTFGGHSYTLKRAQDRLICLLAPFFEKRVSLTHHPARYERAANLFALGWAPMPDTEVTETWRELADANALNLLAPRVGAALVSDADRGQWPATIRALLASSEVPGAGIPARAPLREALLHAAAGVARAANAAAPRSAALVVGSAKTRGTSVSENLARALAARLETYGVTTTLHAATNFLHDDNAAAAAQAVAAADLCRRHRRRLDRLQHRLPPQPARLDRCRGRLERDKLTSGTTWHAAGEVVPGCSPTSGRPRSVPATVAT
jgi:hypothetical protein